MTVVEGTRPKEGYWQEQIKNGPNARLFEKLRYIRAAEERCYFFADFGCHVPPDMRLTEEEWYVGVAPIFFGNFASNVIAREFYQGFDSDGGVDLFRRENASGWMERRLSGITAGLEQRRIQELEQGEFSLPQNVDDLLKNIDLQIKRLEDNPDKYSQRRIAALEGTRVKIATWASSSKPPVYSLHSL